MTTIPAEMTTPPPAPARAHAATAARPEYGGHPA